MATLPKVAAQTDLFTIFLRHPNIHSACKVLVAPDISAEKALQVWEKCKQLKFISPKVASHFVSGVARRGNLEQLENAINQAHLNSSGKVTFWDLAYLQHYSVKKDYRKILETLQTLNRAPIDPHLFSFCLKELFSYKDKTETNENSEAEEGEEEEEIKFRDRKREREIQEMTPEMLETLEQFYSCWQYTMKRGALPNIVIENQFIDYFSRSGNTNRALEIVANMKRMHLACDIRTFSPILISLFGRGALDQAEKVWNTMDSLGLYINSAVVYAPFKALSMNAETEVLEKALELCSKKGMKLSEKLLVMVAHNLVDRGEVELTLKCIDMVRLEGTEVKTAVWNSFIVFWAQTKDPQIVQKVTKLVEKHKANFGPYGYRRLILALVEGGNMEEATKWYSKAMQKEEEYGPKFINPVLQVLAKQGKEKELYALVERMKSEFHLQFNSVNVNSVLVFLLNHNLEEKWMSWAEKEGIQKNDITYNILISAFAKRNDEEGVLKYLTEMIKSKFKPDRTTLSSIMALKHVKSKELSLLLADLDIDGEYTTKYAMNSKAIQSGRKGEVEETQQMMDEMRARGLAPDSVTYTSIIAAYAKKSDYASVRRTYFDMKNKDIKPTSATFMVIIKELADGRDRKGLDWWISEMLSSGVKLDRKVVNTIINFFVAIDDLDQVQAWVMRMKELGLKPDLYTYNSFLKMLVKKGDLEAVDKWLATMKQEGVPATTITYNIIMTELYAHNYPQRAEHFRDRMKEEKLAPDMHSYGIWVRAAAVNGDLDKVNELLGEMEANKVEGTPVAVYNAILHHLDTETLENASYWLDRMKSKGVKPNVITYSIMIEKCGDVGDKKGMEVWVKLMKEAGVKLNFVTYLVLVKKYADVGDLQTAERYLQEAERAANVDKRDMLKIYNRFVRGIAMHSENAEEEINQWLERTGKMWGNDAVNAMIRDILLGYTKVNNIPKSFEWLEKLQKRVNKLFFWNVSIVGEACARVGDIDGIRKTFEILQKQGVMYYIAYMDNLLNLMEESTIQKNIAQLEDIVITFYDSEQRSRIKL